MFYGCARVSRHFPVLDRAIAKVLTFADEGSTPLVLATTLANGASEEVFFRGALYAATSAPHQVALTTAAYAATTVGTKNPALVLAATVMGTLFGLQRRGTGGHPGPAADAPDLVGADAALPAAAVPRKRRPTRLPAWLSSCTRCRRSARLSGTR